MEPDFSLLFHQSSKDGSKGHPPISKDQSLWPSAWNTVYYKAYERFSKVMLPEETMPTCDFFEVLQERRSQRKFSPQPMSLREISLLLKYSCGNIKLASDKKTWRRAQPSGGARYPIEVYPLVLQANKDLPAGFYHYNVKMHALDQLWSHDLTAEALEKIFRFEGVYRASMVLIMTAVFRRTQMKYGERGYRLVLLEVGHVGQNMYLVGESLGLKVCGIGGTNDLELENLLDVDGIQESVVYALAIGH